MIDIGPPCEFFQSPRVFAASHKDCMKLPRFILRAEPTCTLWRQRDYCFVWYLALWPSLVVSAIEIVEAG